MFTKKQEKKHKIGVKKGVKKYYQRYKITERCLRVEEVIANYCL